MELIFKTAGVILIVCAIFMFYSGTRNIMKGYFMLLFSSWKPWQLERLKICNECAPDRDTCPQCLCFKEPKVKLLSEKCPLDKWPKQSEYKKSSCGRVSSGISKECQDSKYKY